MEIIPIAELIKLSNKHKEKPQPTNQSQSPFERALQLELKKVRPQGYPSC